MSIPTRLWVCWGTLRLKSRIRSHEVMLSAEGEAELGCSWAKVPVVMSFLGGGEGTLGFACRRSAPTGTYQWPSGHSPFLLLWQGAGRFGILNGNMLQTLVVPQAPCSEGGPGRGAGAWHGPMHPEEPPWCPWPVGAVPVSLQPVGSQLTRRRESIPARSLGARGVSRAGAQRPDAGCRHLSAPHALPGQVQGGLGVPQRVEALYKLPAINSPALLIGLSAFNALVSAGQRYFQHGRRAGMRDRGEKP